MRWPTKRLSYPESDSGRGRCSPPMRSLRRSSERPRSARQGLEVLSWIALIALVLGLCASAVLLAPWQLKFAVDARELYDELYEQASAEADTDTLGWLAAAGFGYQALREENARKVRLMSWLSGAVGILMIAQTISWLAALAVE